MVVPAYFGWSAGDIALAIKLLLKLHEAFSETTGASAQFAEAASFLGGFRVTLTRLQAYVASSSSSSSAESQYTKDIEKQLRRIQPPFAAFVEYLGKYEAALGEHPTASTSTCIGSVYSRLSEAAK